jgi:hypothetical protein
MEENPEIKDEKPESAEVVEAPADSQAVPDEKETFLENSIYEGIFRIFEDELEEIGQFVAFTKGNMNTYSNKIHELHLRVCSEIENVLKIVIHKYFVPKSEVDSLWETEKSKRLVKAKVMDKYEEIIAALNAENAKKDTDLKLFGYPDFAFYFKLARKNFNLDKKVIKFLGMVSNSEDWTIVQPFVLADRNIPNWWRNYNNIKHNKLEHFVECTLGDLVQSMAGLYILMNYLLKYSGNKDGYVTNRDFNPHDINSFSNSANFCSYQSKLFDASIANCLILLPLLLPARLSEEQFPYVILGDFKSVSTIKDQDRVNWTQKVEDFHFKSFEYAEEPLGQDIQHKLTNIHHAIFYTYVDYAQYSFIGGHGGYREKQQCAIFVN